MSPRVSVIPLTIFLIARLFISDTRVRAESCGVNVPDLISQCLKYVLKLGSSPPPSEGCCAAVKTVDVLCVCKVLTRDVVGEISKMISTEKAVSVARSCGIQLSPGAHCGSFTIPP